MNEKCSSGCTYSNIEKCIHDSEMNCFLNCFMELFLIIDHNHIRDMSLVMFPRMELSIADSRWGWISGWKIRLKKGGVCKWKGPPIEGVPMNNKKYNKKSLNSVTVQEMDMLRK